MNTLEVRFDRVTRTIITDVLVRRAEKRGGFAGYTPGPDISVRALWDTGATRSVISETLAQRLEISSVGSGSITGIGGTIFSNRYDISVTLPNRIIFPIVCVAEWPGHSDYDMLIGMDIIGQGRFVIDSVAGKTLFTFKA